ncbi:MAG: hypothetical protein JO255_14100, partial [Alphaproteobacteria bacterium]|nr:hypothetical protein [Alphaproteobacteria bacterium]
CNRDNAVNAMRLPEEFSSPVTCALQGQAYLAQTYIGRNLAKDQTLKVLCIPTAMVDKSKVEALNVDLQP